MSPEESPRSLEQVLASLLHIGTWLASGVIAAGLVVAIASAEKGAIVASVGIALFIMLPVVRVATMMFFFARTRDYRFCGFAALVLAIIFSSYWVGAH